MNNTDVLIVGAGPSGLTLAASLVSRGIATTVVDRQAAGANTSRAAVVNARTPRGARRPRCGPAAGQGGDAGAPVQHPRPSAHAHPDRLQHAADRIPVLVDGSAVDDRAVAARPAGRARWLRGPAEDADLVEQDADGVTATFDDGDASGRATWSAPTASTATCASRQASASRAAQYEESFVLADVRLARRRAGRRGRSCTGRRPA